MSADYFLPQLADEADLSLWSDIVPAGSRILRTNLFGDAFLLDEAGAVHMLERAAATISQIAASEEHFWRKLHEDEEGWQLRPLVDECRRAGKLLTDEQCYGFTTLPFLGGDYAESNVWVASWREWFSLTADLFSQTKHLPDGTRINLQITD